MGAAITISSHANGGEVDIFEYLAGVSRDRSRPIVVAERLAGSAGRAGRAALAHTHISYTHTASTRNHECTHSTRLLLFPLKTSAQWHEFARRDWRRLRLRRPASLALVSLIPNTNGLVRGRRFSDYRARQRPLPHVLVSARRGRGDGPRRELLGDFPTSLPKN